MTYLPLWHLFRKGGRTLHVESMVLAQLTPRRFRACLPLIFAVCLVLVASIPAVAGDSERPVQASIFVSRTEASPTENVSFWIWIEPLKEKARKLVITEAPLDGFDVTSTTIPDSCLESRRTWVCIQDDLRPFSIEVQAVAKAGTEGRDIVYGVSVALWKNGEGHDNEDSMDPIQLSASVHSVPLSVVAEANVDVRLEANESAVMPGNPVTYRVDVTNMEQDRAPCVGRRHDPGDDGRDVRDPGTDDPRRTGDMGPRFGADRDDGVVLHRNPASRERLAAGRRGRCGDLRQRNRWSGAPRERAHLTRRPSDATSGSPLAAARTGRRGRPRLRHAIPIPPGRSHRPCLAPSLRSGRGLPPPPKRDTPASCDPDPICRLGLRHRRRDALGDPDVRRDNDESVHRTLAGDPIPRWEYRLRDGGERDLGGAQCEGEPGPVRAACLGIPAPIRKVECSSPPELRWRRLAAPRD